MEYVKYIKNTANLKANGESKDTLAVIGEIYEVIKRKGLLIECDVHGEILTFEIAEVEDYKYKTVVVDSLEAMLEESDKIMEEYAEAYKELAK